MDLPKGLHALIDGDIIRYRCAFAAEKTHYCVTWDDIELGPIASFHGTSKEADDAIKRWTKENADRTYNSVLKWSRKEVQPVEFALQAAKTTLEAIIARLEPSGVSLFLTGTGNFRDKIAVTKPYKGNRDTAQKPVYYEEVGEYLREVWNARTIDGAEADDAIGWGSSDHREHGFVIVTTDKDLDQIPGWHYNWVKSEGYSVSPRDASYAFYQQLLTGDPTDNVPGISGVGKVTAAQLLEGCKNSAELCGRVWSVYKDRYKSAEAARVYLMEQANLLWIQRSKDEKWVAPIELK